MFTKTLHSTFYLTLTNKNKKSFVSSPDSHKSSSPNSIPVKFLKLLKNVISQQLSDSFNVFFNWVTSLSPQKS